MVEDFSGVVVIVPIGQELLACHVLRRFPVAIEAVDQMRVDKLNEPVDRFRGEAVAVVFAYGLVIHGVVLVVHVSVLGGGYRQRRMGDNR